MPLRQSHEITTAITIQVGESDGRMDQIGVACLAQHSTAVYNIFLSCKADAQISIKNVSVCQEIIEILISYNGYLFHSFLLICFVLGFSF